MSSVVTYRPLASLRMGTSLSLSLVAAAFLGWFLTPPQIQAQFTALQLATLLFFIAIIVGVALSLGLCYVRADDAGLTLRNGLKTRTLPWSQVKAFRYREGDPWAYVLVRENDDQFMVMGIQRSDGPRAEAAVADLRRRLAEAYTDGESEAS